jgi:LacI family transcriptional regulator
MTTIKQVADAAGVSFKTVSRVVNGDPYVSTQTRERVQQAIEQLGYRPNLAARHMRTQRSNVIGFITDEIATTPFAVNIIKGAQNQAWEYGCLLMVINTEAETAADRTEDAIEMLLQRRVEGIVYATMRHKLITPPHNLHETRAVLVNCRSLAHTLPSVVPDERSAGERATSAMLEHGRKRIAFINLESGAAAASGRLEGYRRALERHDVAYDDKLVRHTHLDADKRDSGYAEMKALLQSGVIPDGVFCGNDQIAIGVYEALQEAGLRIPQEVAVVGFDNQTLIAPYLHPPLSTMALPHEEMGRWAVKYLMEGGEPPVPPHELLACPYIERQSVSVGDSVSGAPADVSYR